MHRAVSHDGQQLAVKVQHTGLRDTCQADTLVVEVFVRALRWAFPDFNYQWLIDEVKESLPQVSAGGSCLAGVRCTRGLGVGPSAVEKCWKLGTGVVLVLVRGTLPKHRHSCSSGPVQAAHLRQPCQQQDMSFFLQVAALRKHVLGPAFERDRWQIAPERATKVLRSSPSSGDDVLNPEC